VVRPVRGPSGPVLGWLNSPVGFAPDPFALPFVPILNKSLSDRIRRLSIEGMWVVIGQVAAVAGALVSVRLLTEYLAPSEFGELALGLTLASLINQTVFGPLYNGISRFYAPAAEAGELEGHLRAARGLVLGGTVVVAVVSVLLCAILLAMQRQQWLPITLAALVFATVSGYNTVLTGVQNAARQRAVVALHQGAEPWVRVAAAILVILLLGAFSAAALAGYVLASCGILASQWWFLRRLRPARSDPARARHWRAQTLQYAWPFAVWGIFYWAQSASDRWALGLLSGTADVGLYAVLYQLGYYPVSMATGMAMQFLTPIFFARAGDASDSARSAGVTRLSGRLTLWSLLMTLVLGGLAFALHAEVFRVFLAREYWSASALLPWMVLGGGVFAAGQIIALNLMSQLKTRSMMVAKIGTAVLGVVFNFAGAYWFGMRGVVFAGLAFSVVYLVWMAALQRSFVASAYRNGV
jgi:O-antigen/teichoic acid export membrane protein